MFTSSLIQILKPKQRRHEAKLRVFEWYTCMTNTNHCVTFSLAGFQAAIQVNELRTFEYILRQDVTKAKFDDYECQAGSKIY